MIKVDDKNLAKLMKRLGFVCNAVTKHTLVFSNGVHKVRTSKTTSDKQRRLKNLSAELRRLNYVI